jgi:hypothetical protein
MSSFQDVFKKMQCWSVMIGNREIDRVFYQKGMSASEVRESLINHDNYSPRITVIKIRF